eukprot:scaffold284_cov127-Isochrysis_galbana.AAC.7
MPYGGGIKFKGLSAQLTLAFRGADPHRITGLPPPVRTPRATRRYMSLAPMPGAPAGAQELRPQATHQQM